MTLAEFAGWESGDTSGLRWQLVDGEPFAMAPASETHGALQSELARVIGNHLLAVGSRCRVITEPGIVPRVRSADNYRIPDLGVTCAPPGQGTAVQQPVLLIEILSPSNEAETRANIWSFTTIPSVAEIVSLSTTRIEAEFLRRQPDGSWPETPDIVGAEGDLSFSAIGLTLTLRDCYRTTALAIG